MQLPDFKRGDTFDLPLAVTEKGPSGVMEPVNITGWTILMKAREETEVGRVVHNFTFDVIDAASGKGAFVASPSVTRRWPLKPLVMDIVIRDATGNEVTSRTIQMNVEERVSR